MFFSTQILLSQEAKPQLKVTETPEYKDKVKTFDIIALHANPKGQSAVIRKGKKVLYFDVFNQSLDQKLHSESIDIDKKEKVRGYLAEGNAINVFTVLSPKKKERIVYCYVFDLENYSHKKTKLFDITVEKNHPIFSGGNKRQTDFAISPDGKHLAVTTDNSKKSSNDYNVSVFETNNYSLVYQQRFIKNPEYFYTQNDIYMDNAQNVYVLGKLYKNGKAEKKGGDANYIFTFTKINSNGTQSSEIGLSEDTHIRSLSIQPTNETFNLLGFYSEKKVNKIKGVCSFKLDKNSLSIIDKKLKELPLSVFEDMVGKKRSKKIEGAELPNFYIDYVLLDDYGNTYILAEEFYVTQTQVMTANASGGFSYYYQTIYHYDDILIMKFSPSGELEYGRTIFKRANELSYYSFVKNNKLHVILNSGKKIKEKKDGRTKVSQGFLESSALYDIVFDQTSEPVYGKIQDNKNATFYSPYNGSFNNDKFIMMSYPKNKKQFMILE